MSYSEQIYKLRRESDISQDALALAIGTTRQQISRWECGTSVPSMKYIQKMANYFNTDINTIMGTQVGDDTKEAIDSDGKSTEKFKNRAITLSIIISVVYFLFGTIFEVAHRIMFAMSRAGAEHVDGDYVLFEIDSYSDQIHSTLLQGFIVIATGIIAIGTLFFILNFKEIKNKIYKYKSYKYYILFLSISLACITGYLYKLLRFPYATMSDLDFVSYYCGMFLLFRALFTLITMVIHKATKDNIMIFEPSKKLFIAKIIYLSIMFILIALFIYELIINVNNPNSFVDYYYLCIVYFPLSFVINVVFEIVFLKLKDKKLEE